MEIVRNLANQGPGLNIQYFQYVKLVYWCMKTVGNSLLSGLYRNTCACRWIDKYVAKIGWDI